MSSNYLWAQLSINSHILFELISSKNDIIKLLSAQLSIIHIYFFSLVFLNHCSDISPLSIWIGKTHCKLAYTHFIFQELNMKYHQGTITISHNYTIEHMYAYYIYYHVTCTSYNTRDWSITMLHKLFKQMQALSITTLQTLFQHMYVISTTTLIIVTHAQNILLLLCLMWWLC